MNRIFNLKNEFKVPDGTLLYEVLGPGEERQDKLPILGEMSLAMGDLPPGVQSSVHVHPLVAHLAWVLSGTLTVKMKDPGVAEPYMLDVLPRQAVYTAPGTFFQLINRSDGPVQVLYIVAPTFVFETDESGRVLYNDAVVLSKNWEELAAGGWRVPELENLDAVRKQRSDSLARMGLIGGAVSKEIVGADLIPANGHALSEEEREKLWHLFQQIGREWGDVLNDSANLKSSWLELIEAKTNSEPSYAGEYASAVRVVDELVATYGDAAFQKLFFENGLANAPATTRLAHAKHFVVDEFIRMQMLASGFKSFGKRPLDPAQPTVGRLNYKGYIGGSRFHEEPVVRAFIPAKGGES